MRYEIKIQVRDIDHHRNGISGAPFWAVRFSHVDDSGISREMVAAVFEQPGVVAVLAVDRLPDDGVTFGLNSWRGDSFEPLLRQAIERALSADSPATVAGNAPMGSRDCLKGGAR